MKPRHTLLLVTLISFASLSFADREIEIEFRFQPDGSGMKTRNQGIKVEDNEVEIYLDGDEKELDASQVDIEGLYQLVKQCIQNFEMLEGDKVRTPYIEVKMEFSGEDREIEVSNRYPTGRMPAELVKLQQNYLDEVWK